MSIRFCDLCGNMLTPQLKDSHKLIYSCEICNTALKEKENSKENNLVYRNEIRNEQNSIKIDNYITNDPTYARSLNLICKKCGHKESICFQNPNINDPGMQLIYLCCNKNYEGTGEPCNFIWYKIGTKFVIVPNDWDMLDQQKILETINIYGFDIDMISLTIKKFNEIFNKELNKKLGPIDKLFYDKKELESNTKSIWRDIYRKDCKVYAFYKYNCEYFEDKGILKKFKNEENDSN